MASSLSLERNAIQNWLSLPYFLSAFMDDSPANQCSIIQSLYEWAMMLLQLKNSLIAFSVASAKLTLAI